MEKDYKRESKEYEALQKATQAVIKEMSKFDKEHVKFEEKKKFLSNKHTKLEKALHSSRLAGSEATSLVEKYSDDVKRNTKEIAALEKNLVTEEKELDLIRDSLKGKTQAFSDQIASKQKSLEPWNAKINEKQSIIAVNQSELDILRERASAGAVALAEVQSKINSFEESRHAKETELDQSKSKKKQLERDATKVRDELAKLAHTEPELRSQLSGARQRADEAKASLASSQTQGNVLSGLNRLKEQGRVNGFHGRLGNLGTIDQKYDVAISTACGSLDNLVVDSVEVGQQCIDHLRKNNLGRANFILLDRLANRDMGPITTPEGVPRLLDLVKSRDQIFRSAFYSVLQNTLVANDLEQANRIAYGARRWRVVTLDGQLIDVSGTMSGGGTRVARGGMSSKLVAETSKDQVAKLEVDRERLEREIQAFQDKQRELEGNLKNLNDQIPQVETLIQKTGLEIESLKRNIADAQRRVSELTAAQHTSKSNDARVGVLEKQISNVGKEMDKLRAETLGVEEEIKELQNKIMEVGGVRLRGQKAKVDGLKQQIETLTEEISNSEVAISKAEKQKTKHEKSFADTQEELASTADEIKNLADEIKNQSTDASSLRRQVEESQEVCVLRRQDLDSIVLTFFIKGLEAKQEQLAALKRDLDEKTNELNGIRAVEIELRNRLEENQKVLSENQKRLKYWSEKLSKISLQRVRYVISPQKKFDIPFNNHAIAVTSGKQTPSKSFHNTPKTSSATWTRTL